MVSLMYMLQLTHYHLLPTHNLPLSFTSIACYKEVDSESTHVHIADLFLHIVDTAQSFWEFAFQNEGNTNGYTSG